MTSDAKKADRPILWEPSVERANSSNLARFSAWAGRRHASDFSRYEDLWRWSVDESGEFWSSLADYFGVRFHAPPRQTLERNAPAYGRWFSGALLNYAEHALRPGPDDDATAIFYEAEGDTAATQISRRELRRQVAVLAGELRRAGVAPGDRVAGYLANSPEAIVAFLATASLGATWSNCSAEFSAGSVLERFTQIAPKVLIATAGYRYGSRFHDRSETIVEICSGLTSLQTLLVVGNSAEIVAARIPLPRAIAWRDLPWSTVPPLDFAPVPFDHPLWILYSSGTTGTPKAIVHGHGGMLLEHLKVLSLHLDLRPGDRFFWLTSSGWMMWNFLVSALLLPGVAIVLYDGSPKHPDWNVLWDFVERLGITYFGASAPYLTACERAGVHPAYLHTFPSLRSIGSTGAPLSPEGFHWVYQKVKADVLLGSVSGGTDVCTAFVVSNPLQPVRAGELQCLALGARIEAWDDNGRPVVGGVGELVLTAPFPAMPVGLWGDASGERFQATYFSKFPGAWAHGDGIEIATPPLRCVIHGRTDATLNRGGVRMGTAEIYTVVERIPGIADSLVVDTTRLGMEGQLILFVALQPGVALDDRLREDIRRRLRADASPRHVPDVIHAVAEIPRTLNGKKMEVPIKRILSGVPVAVAVSREAIANPQALAGFTALVPPRHPETPS